MARVRATLLLPLLLRHRTEAADVPLLVKLAQHQNSNNSTSLPTIPPMLIRHVVLWSRALLMAIRRVEPPNPPQPNWIRRTTIEMNCTTWIIERPPRPAIILFPITKLRAERPTCASARPHAQHSPPEPCDENVAKRMRLLTKLIACLTRLQLRAKLSCQ